MEILDRRKLFYRLLKEELILLKFNNTVIKHKVTKGKLELWFDDGMYALVDVVTLVTHHKKGEFGVYFGLSIYNGKIYNTLLETKLFQNLPSFDRGRYFNATHHNIVPKNLVDGLYNFYEDIEVKSLVRCIVSHIKDYTIPIVYGFQSNPAFLLNFYNEKTKGIYGIVSNPFCIGVILCILSKNENEISKIIEYAKGEHAITYTDFNPDHYKMDVKKLTDYLCPVL